MSYGDDEIVALMAKPYVKQHPAFERVVGRARKAFPDAGPVHAASTIKGTGLARDRRRGART